MPWRAGVGKMDRITSAEGILEDERSIYVALVAAVLLHVRHVLGGFFRGLAAPRLDDFVKGRIHVLRHAGGISADVEARAVLQPLPEFFTLLDHEVLDVNLLFLIARPGYGQLQLFRSRQFVQFALITKIGSLVRIAEEQPVAAPGSGGDAFLPESAEGSDAGAGTHHDDGSIPILGKPEILVGMDEHPGVMAGLEAIRHVRGAYAAALAFPCRVAHGAYTQVNFLRMGVRAGSDGIQARHDLFQDADKGFRGFKGGGILRSQIQHVAAPQEVAQGVFVPCQQGFQFLAAGSCRPFGQQRLVHVRDIVAGDQGFTEGRALSVRRADCGAGAEPQFFNQGIRQPLIIGGNDGQGVPGDIFHSGTVQAELNVNGLFRAAFSGNVLDGEDGCGERVFLAVWFG